MNNLLSKVQHGFVQRRSTRTNLMECINDWTLTVEYGHSVTVVYIDFNKAFDCVSHNKLLFARFSHCGIDGDLLEWLQSFLATELTAQSWYYAILSCGVNERGHSK